MEETKLPAQRPIVPRQNSLAYSIIGRDAGTAREITTEQIMSLVAWAEAYGLDARQSHVCLMYGKPYVTEVGYVYLARRRPGYKGFSLSPVHESDKGALGYLPTDVVWECAVFLEGLDRPIVEYGVVTQHERDVLSEQTLENIKKDWPGPKQDPGEIERELHRRLGFLPVFRNPSDRARTRAIRRAHRLAVPDLAIPGQGEGEVPNG